MRVLVVGASGLIGSAVAAHLTADQHEVVGISRHPPEAGLGTVQHVAFDLAASTPENFLPLLAGVDAIVNCAGTLQDAPGDSTAGVHHKGVASLVAACEKMGVRRFIHLSAIGVDRETTSFSASKHMLVKRL